MSLRCIYCGARDKLPDDQLERALELRRRAAAAARAALQLDGLSTALSHVFESPRAYLRVSSTWLVIAAIATLQAAVNGWPILSKTPAAYWPFLLIQVSIGPALVLGTALSFVLALAVARRAYRRSVRPLLAARPPREPGTAARCRVCGGDLPGDRGPFLRCRYCSTQNLVTPELQREHDRLLAREENEYRRQSSRIAGQTSRTSALVTRVLMASVAAVWVLMIGIAAASQWLLPGR